MSAALQNFETLEISQLVELIRVTETTERYEDMCKFVKKLIEIKSERQEDLDIEERNFFAVAYKNVIGSRRLSWRTLNEGGEREEEEETTEGALLKHYKSVVAQELEEQCQEVITLLVDRLLKIVNGQNSEPEVFYLKMVGDYYRYLAEFRQSNELFKEKSREYYQKALDVAQDCLVETHPTRLGLELNFSVCYYEILKQPEKACELAKTSFDEAIAKLDGITDKTYRDATLIMQLLRDNLTLWTSEQGQEEDD